MGEYDKYNMFLRPERPFLILCHLENKDCNDCKYIWMDTEEEVKDWIEGCKKDFDNFVLDDVFEIGSIREVKL